jgi:hypothetical protein
MKHTDYRTLIDRGRKAGLGTNELYRAMQAHRPETETTNVDTNGFVVGYVRGQRVIRPHAQEGRG